MTYRRGKSQRSLPRTKRPLGIETLEGRAVFAASVLSFENINSTNAWADIRESVNVGNQLFWVARDHGKTNLNLWTIDNTLSAAKVLADLGPDDAGTRQLTNVNGTLFFQGYSPSEGFELWKSNGTVSGTALVRALKPGLPSSTLTHLTNVAGTLYFSGNGELLKSNGTSAGTTRVKDLHVGASDEVAEITAVGNTIYFTAKSPVGSDGVSLYQTQGTSSSTQAVASVSGTTLRELTAVGSQLFFARNQSELWRHNSGAAAAEQLYNSTFRLSLKELTNVNGSLFFADGDTLVTFDGTTAGFEFLVQGYERPPQNFFESNNLLYFSFGDRGSFGSANGQELWRSDGTVEGTLEVKNVNPLFDEGYGLGSYPHNFAESGGRVFFEAFDGRKNGLWTSDGTDAGTQLVEPFARRPVHFNGQLFYSRVDDGNVHLMRLPTGQSTPVEVTRPGAGVSNSNPSTPVSYNGSLYFFAEDGISGRELRRRNSDGSIDLVADVSPGPADTIATDLEAANGLLYFTVLESNLRPALWRSNGTAAGTFRLASVLATPNRSDLAAPKFVAVNQSVFFSGISNDGEELWTSDGSVRGTFQVKNIYPGSTYVPYEGTKSNASSPTELTNFQGTLVFAANDDLNGRELWKSNGTSGGTTLLVDHFPGAQANYPDFLNSSSPFALQIRSGKLNYLATDATGVRFFESNGTPVGSVPTSSPIPGLVSYTSLKAVGNKIFFAGNTRTSQELLWVSDGTISGTMLLKDIRPGRYSERMNNFTELDGVLYFTADDGIRGNELWKSDGTPEGTVLVQDISPGSIDGRPADSNPTQLTAFNGALFFSARSDTSEYGLWRTNGTNPGATRIVANGTANPSGFYPMGSRLVYAADSTLGRELFQLSAASPVLTLAANSVTYREGDSGILLARNATLTDNDSPVLLGGRLTVALQGALPGDELRVVNAITLERLGNLLAIQGVVFGQIAPESTPTSLVIHLNQHATLARTQRLIQALAFRSSSNNSQATPRIVRLTLNDGETGVFRTNMTVQYVPVNDAPTLSGLAPVSYRRNNAAGVAFAANASVNDVDSPNFAGGELRISVAGGDAANNRLSLSGNLFTVDNAGVLRRGTLIIGSVLPNSGIGLQPFVMQFNRSVRASTVSELLGALRFQTTNSVSNQARTISLSLLDGDGGLAQASVRVNVTN